MLIPIIFIAPFVTALLSLFMRGRAALGGLSIAASVVEVVSASLIALSVVKNGPYVFTDYISVDPLGAILLVLVALVGALVSVHSIGYLGKETEKGIIGLRRMRQYFVFLNLFLMAMFFAVTTSSPILMWISIEATTLATAFLISFYGKPSSIEAAWKYLIINSVGLLCALFGTLLFLYPVIQAGTAGVLTWNILHASAPFFDPLILQIAFVFVLIGYGTKAGLVPMHTWLPDAHSKAPPPISALLSGVLLNVAFFAVLRHKGVVDAALGSGFSQELLIFFGVLSIVVASFIILIQKNYKRLLAYSSVEHMGIIALGFGFGGAASAAALLHLIYHSLTKSTLFLSAGNIFLKFSSTKIKDVQGVFSVLPITGVVFMLGFLSITGIPPFGTFLTEFSILSEGIRSHPALTAVALLSLALVFVGFLRHIVSMLFGEPAQWVTKGESGTLTFLPVLVLIVILIVSSFFIPAELRSLIDSAVSA